MATSKTLIVGLKRGSFCEIMSRVRLTLNSSASRGLHPDNEDGDFTVKLAERLTLKQGWKVALAELIHPNRICNIRNTQTEGFDISKNEIIIYRQIINAFLNSPMSDKICWKAVKSFSVPEGVYDDYQYVMKYIMNETSWDKWTESSNDPDLMPVDLPPMNFWSEESIEKMSGAAMKTSAREENKQGRIDLEYDKEDCRIVIRTKNHYGIRLGSDVEEMLGMSKKYIDQPSLKEKEYFCYFSTAGGIQRPSTRRITDVIYVNASISAAQQMGGQQARCLRIVAVSEDKNAGEGSVSRTFPELYYNDFYELDFENVNILLADKHGQMMRFIGGETIAVLFLSKM